MNLQNYHLINALVTLIEGTVEFNLNHCNVDTFARQGRGVDLLVVGLERLQPGEAKASRLFQTETPVQVTQESPGQHAAGQYRGIRLVFALHPFYTLLNAAKECGWVSKFTKYLVYDEGGVGRLTAV